MHILVLLLRLSKYARASKAVEITFSVLGTNLLKGDRGGRDGLIGLFLLRLWSRPLHRLHLLPHSLCKVRNLSSEMFTHPDL